MKLNYTATCLFGLEGFLGEEIEALGCKRTDNMDGRITFEGDENTAAEASVNLRYAERLYLNLGSFEALTFTELFDGAKSIPWDLLCVFTGIDICLYLPAYRKSPL